MAGTFMNTTCSSSSSTSEKGTTIGKEAIRAMIKAKLKTQPREIINDALYEKIALMSEYKNAQTIAVFISVHKEVDTRRFIEKAYEDGKQVLIPFWTSPEGDMEMTTVGLNEYRELLSKPSAYYKEKYNHSIPMPDPESSSVYTTKIDVAIIPGLAFSRLNRHRIGYGYGHYDRFLKTHDVLFTVGVCFECQLLDSFDFDDFDVCVDTIISV